MRFVVLSFLLLAGCPGGDPKETGDTSPDDTGFVDADGDGVDAATDCNDEDDQTYPGAPELCDGRDNDCDRDIDEGLDTTPRYADDDGDGWGDDEDVVDSCVALAGRVDDGGDCDDSDGAYHPGAPEDCADPNDYNCDGSTSYADADGDGWPACQDCDDADDGVNPGVAESCNGRDDDCDAEIDEDDALDASWWYADADDDGWGVEADAVRACEAPEGYTGRDGDCDDADARFHPTAAETDCADPNDYNCDGSVGYEDNDGDGVPACEDCDDHREQSFPGADELCNGHDDDCDGVIDEDDALDAASWFPDGDGDGWGTDDGAVRACDEPVGYAAEGGDCDDTDVAYHPEADEDDCTDPADYNCDGSVGYADEDGDGVAACEDCDDANPDAYPGAVEHCDGADDDCDGVVDEADAIDATTWYLDYDHDGYGRDDVTVVACDAPTAYADQGGDCDDGDPAFHPDAEEDDCADPNDYNCDGSVGYADVDHDGVAACDDCDDTDASIYPGAVERCNGSDDDCDGSVDEATAVDATTWYRDADEDGYAGSATTVVACEAPDGFYATVTDCDDGASAVHPGATERCNGYDDNCDGATDDASSADAGDWYDDADHDGYGEGSTGVTACDAPTGTVPTAGDCDDGDGDVHPGADEYCNGYDDDCDSAVDEPSAVDASTWYGDGDSDGYGDVTDQDVACSAASGYVGNDDDCDDGNAAVHPGATETCNDVDDDCDGVTDPSTSSGAGTWYRDADTDGYGAASTTTTACDMPSGYVANDDDCLDSNAAVHPGATETCNGLDDDCDGSTDPSTASGAGTWYADGDADGYGDPADATVACTAPSGRVGNDDDCDPTDGDVHPGATEVCNGIDDDCDGAIDPASSADAGTWYLDGDADGWGVAGTSVVACAMPSGYADQDGDCADDDNATNPDATEICDDGIDNDCDGTTNGCETTGSFLPSATDWMISGDDRYEGLGGAAVGGAFAGGTTPYVAIGSAGWDGSESSGTAFGRVVIWEGPLTGGEGLGDAVATIFGLDGDGGLGTSLALGEDADHDGAAELLVGAPGDDADAAGIANAGGVYRFAGDATGALTAGDALASWFGDGENDAFGTALAAVGDIDLDGVADLVVGATGADGAATDAGFAGLYALDATGDLTAADAFASAWGEGEDDAFGSAVAGGADVDGDGVGDVLVGAVGVGSHDGSAYVFLGGFGGVDVDAGDADAIADGSSEAGLGKAVALLPDLDGDGYGDLAVGAPGGSGGGKVYAWLGGSGGPWSGRTTTSTADATLTAQGSEDLAGISVASAGDPDNDGDTDLLVGATGCDQSSVANAGCGYLMYAPFTGTVSLGDYGVRVAGDDTDDAFGSSVAGLGDLDGDGLDDWGVGGVGDDEGGTTTGSFVVLWGSGM